MQLTIFIGHHKTGSTALQDYLSRNFYRFLRRGILYPFVETQGFAVALSRAVRRRDALRGVSMNVREPHNAMAMKMMQEADPTRHLPDFHTMLPHSRQMFEAIRNQVAELEPEHVVLCAEAMANFANWPQLIEKIRDLLPEAELRILCTLRRPDDYLPSWHVQRLRFRARNLKALDSAYGEYRDSVHVDYRRMLEPWIELCPEAVVDVREHSEVMATGGSIADFKARSGIPFPRFSIPGVARNDSLPYAAFEVLSRAATRLERDDYFALLSFLEEEAARIKPPSNRQVEMLGTGAREALARDFGPIHEWLSGLAGREEFFPGFSDTVREERPISLAEAEDELVANLNLSRLPPDSAARLYLADLLSERRMAG